MRDQPMSDRRALPPPHESNLSNLPRSSGFSLPCVTVPVEQSESAGLYFPVAKLARALVDSG